MSTDFNGVVNGPIPEGAPHLKIPFTIKTDGTAATVQQDTSEDVVQCVAVLFGTDPGTRLMVPSYGITDPTFAGINQVRVQAAVKQWEPRATVTMQYTPDGIEQVAVSVAGGTS